MRLPVFVMIGLGLMMPVSEVSGAELPEEPAIFEESLPCMQSAEVQAGFLSFFTKALFGWAVERAADTIYDRYWLGRNGSSAAKQAEWMGSDPQNSTTSQKELRDLAKAIRKVLPHLKDATLSDSIVQRNVQRELERQGITRERFSKLVNRISVVESKLAIVEETQIEHGVQIRSNSGRITNLEYSNDFIYQQLEDFKRKQEKINEDFDDRLWLIERRQLREREKKHQR